MRAWAKANGVALAAYLSAYIEGLRWALDPTNKMEAVNLYAGRLNLPHDMAEETYAIATDPVRGFAKDASFDQAGFACVLRLRADFEGHPPAAPEKYIDLSYYEGALAGL